MPRTARICTLIVAAALFLGALGGREVAAQQFGPYWMYGGTSSAMMTIVPNPPYFAVHPPVYYSDIVPRTYGYSPYAYPGSVMTPAAGQTQPLEIINPHVEAATTETIEPIPDPAVNESAWRERPTTLTIINPFVENEGSSGTLGIMVTTK